MEKRRSADENSTEKGLPDHEVQSLSAERDPERAIVVRFSFMGSFLKRLFDSGVEGRGVERVPEDQRDDVHYWHNLFMWWSVNITLTTIPVGLLAQSVFTLTLPHAIATILCFGVIGATATSFIATLGPQMGLRTMVITRFSSGYAGGTIYSIINILTQLGWAVIAVILGGQTLASINPGTLPLIVGIIIVSICSLIPCFIGYDMVHKVERYVWIPLFIIMLFILGLGAKAGFEIKAQVPREDTGRSISADVISFGGIVFSTFAGWSPVAADYNCRMPASTPPAKVFFLTFIGLYIPICFLEILGALLMTITDPAYTSAFEEGSAGGLVSQVLSPWKGGGKFLLVILAMSIIANNMLNTYSAGLSMQSLGRPFAMIPRFFWTVIGFIAYTVAGIAGREHFSEVLTNFLSILGFWTAFYIVIVAEEHFIFRRKNGPLGGYNLDDWDSPSRLPLGIAGILAGCFGVAGAVVGMAQVWYIGPIGKLAGGAFGTDLGFELAAAFSAVTYPVFRWLEIKYTGR